MTKDTIKKILNNAGIQKEEIPKLIKSFTIALDFVSSVLNVKLHKLDKLKQARKDIETLSKETKRSLEVNKFFKSLILLQFFNSPKIRL